MDNLFWTTMSMFRLFRKSCYRQISSKLEKLGSAIWNRTLYYIGFIRLSDETLQERIKKLEWYHQILNSHDFLMAIRFSVAIAVFIFIFLNIEINIYRPRFRRISKEILCLQQVCIFPIRENHFLAKILSSLTYQCFNYLFKSSAFLVWISNNLYILVSVS